MAAFRTNMYSAVKNTIASIATRGNLLSARYFVHSFPARASAVFCKGTCPTGSRVTDSFTQVVFARKPLATHLKVK